MLLLDGAAVQALLQPDAVLAAVREAFVLHGEHQGRVFPVVRETLATGGVFGIKSGDVAAQGLLVSRRPASGRPTDRWAASRTRPPSCCSIRPAAGPTA